MIGPKKANNPQNQAGYLDLAISAGRTARLMKLRQELRDRDRLRVVPKSELTKALRD